MATATYRPTVAGTDVSGGGEVISPELAMDNDLATYSIIKAINPGESAAANYNGFSPDLNKGARASVTLRVNVFRLVWDSTDAMFLWFRSKPSETLVMVGKYLIGDVPAGQSWIEADITGLAGTDPMDGFTASVTFANSNTFDPPPPVVS